VPSGRDWRSQINLKRRLHHVKAIVSLFAAGLNAVEEKFGFSSTAPQKPHSGRPTDTPVNFAQANTKGPSKG
jgi:hypothetical protein